MSDWPSWFADHWFWLSAGLLLGAAEMLLPGFFLIWLAIAAIITGLLAFLLPIGIVAQTGIFALFAIATVYAARRWLVANPIGSTDPLLNDRGARLVGEIVTVVEAFENGGGRVKVGDGVWNASGPDAVVGARMRIIGANGASLIVEAC